ncbi:phage tail spike protein [uncultured Finegoldia sp.]|uniref:phage tail spike protein n=1 Tax=uncultured Finegoldia sp. TaxID=328009 RepID=UPI0028046880|nr:phage tail spike protein [uncultured Finegoldia sp.]MDU1409777.1 phage tail spike protein [Veillonella sp.]
MLYFFDNQEKLLGYIDNESSLSVIQTEPLRGVIVLEASVIDGYSELLEASTYVGHVDAVNDDSFQLYRIKSISLGDGNVGAKISAQHVVFDELSSRDIIRKVSFNGLNMSAAFMEILKESRWKLGECNVNKSVNLSAENTNVSNLITTLINKYSIELRYRLKFANNKIIGRFIDVFENRGRNTHKRYAYGHNALSVVKEVDSNNLYTAIIPHGKEIEQSEEERKAKKEKQKLDITKVAWSKLNGNYVDKKIGEDTLELKELSQIYGFSDGSPRTMFKNYDIDDENELIKTAYEDLVNLARPKVQFSAKIEDLGELDIGDSIVIIRSDLGIYYRTRVIEIKRNLIEYGLSELVLGDNLDLKNPQKSTNRLSKQISDLETQINNINVETNKVKDSIKDTSFLDDLRKQLKDGMYDHDSYNYFLKKGNEYGLPPGFYAFNKPIDQNPTSGIWMNGGEMAIANKRNADGTLNWSTWLNGEGIIADYITAGILQGGKVRWNLEDGTFLIGNSISDYSFCWDGSTLHMKDVDIDLTNNSVVKNMNQNIDKNNEDIKKANDVITQTQTSVQILKDSISSKVSKTEILSDKEIQNALKGRDGADGANGSNFTWNMLLKSNVVVENDKYNISNYDLSGDFVVGEDYTLTIWGKLGEDRTRFDFYNSESYVRLEGTTEISQGVYSVSFKWKDTREYNGVVHKGDNSKLLVYAYPSDGKSTSRIDKIKLEKGINTNPVWSPHISEIKGEKGDRGEQGIRGLQGRDGIQGKDGVISFTHIAYSNSQDGGKDFSTSNSNREYIGIYVDSNKTDSENYKAYKWSKIKGLDGKNGIAGKAGADGKTPYLHIAYSNSQDGSKDFSVNDSNRDYIGQYTDFSKADSTDYKKYSWSKIKGEFEGEIGGRNLIKNSDKITGWTKYDGGNHLITDEYMEEFNIQGQRIKSDAANATDFIKTYVNFDVDDLVVGKTYTFSVYVKNNRDVPARLRIQGFDWNFAYELQPNEYKRFVITGKRDNMEGYWKNRIQFQLRSANKGQFVDMTVSRPQLEEGDVATSWKPNPLDLISETQTVKRTFEAYKEQTDKALTDKVSIISYNANNKQIQQQISNVTQTANSITQRVSNIDKRTSDLATKYSQVKQTTDSISSTVSSKLGKTEVQSLIKQTVDNITIKASQIDFSGNVSITGELRTKYYSGNTALWMKNDSLKAYEDNTYNNEIGYFGGRAWSDEAYPYHLSISHGMDYHTTISYEGSSNYHPYILFDAYNNVDPSFVDSSGNATIRKHQYDPVGGIKYMMRELHTERNYFTDKVFHQDHVWVQKDLYFGNGVGIERAGRDDYVVFGKMSQVGGVATGGLKFMSNGRVYTEGSVFVNNEIRWNANYPIFFGNGYGVQLTNSYIAIGRITSDGTVTDGIYIEGTELRALRDNQLGVTLN